MLDILYFCFSVCGVADLEESWFGVRYPMLDILYFCFSVCGVADLEESWFGVRYPMLDILYFYFQSVMFLRNHGLMLDIPC